MEILFITLDTVPFYTNLPQREALSIIEETLNLRNNRNLSAHFLLFLDETVLTISSHLMICKLKALQWDPQ